MNPRGISIAGLMGIVLVTGLGVAALRSPTARWTNLASTVVLILLLTAALGAIYLRGAERAYWSGFALFGGVYLLLVDWSWIGGQFGYDLTSGFGEIAERAVAVEVTPAAANSPIQVESMARRSTLVGNFVQIGRLWIALLLALFGGFTARAFASRSERERLATPASRNPL